MLSFNKQLLFLPAADSSNCVASYVRASRLADTGKGWLLCSIQFSSLMLFLVTDKALLQMDGLILKTKTSRVGIHELYIFCLVPLFTIAPKNIENEGKVHFTSRSH